MEKITHREKLISYIEKADLQQVINNEILSVAELVQFKKDEYLIREGILSDYLYFLVKGEVKVFSYTLSDKVLCKGYLHSAQVLGEASTLWEKPAGSSVQALSCCICISINLVKHRSVLLNSVSFLQYTCQILSNRLNHNFCHSLLDPFEIRLADFILNHSPENIFSFNLTECAVILVTSYRHLLRVIKAFCESEILKKRKADYIIIDKDHLLRISQGTIN